MMLKIDISKLDKDLIKGVKILSSFYHFKIGKGGIILFSEKISKGFEIENANNRCTIKHASKVLFFTAFSHLLQYKKKPFMVKRDTIKNLGIMRDSARNAVLSVDGLKELALYSAMMGYNYIEIYAEDLFELKEYPYFGLNRGRYTKEEIKEMDKYCQIFGVELVPCIQTLAHLPHLFRYDYFNDVHDIADILLIDEYKTYKLIDTLITFISQNFSSKRINIGMDEAHLFGQGQFAERFGNIRSRAELFLKHLNKVVEICRSKGFSPSIWSDMIFKVAFNVYSLQAYEGIQGEISEVIKNNFPKGVQLIFWDYYNTDKKFYDTILSYHYLISHNIAFAGGVWSFSGFAPLNSISEERLSPAISSVIENKCNDFLLTSWGNGGGESHCMTAASTMLFVAEKLTGNCELKYLNERAKTIFGNTYEQLKSIEIVDRTSTKNGLKQGNVVNCSKYLLYNDPLLGIMDVHARMEMKQAYKENSKLLKKVAYGKGKLNRYFKPIYKLSRCLEIKSTLGLEITNAYQNQDVAKLKKIYRTVLPMCLKRVDGFFKEYRKTYLSCNKSYGVEVVDIRCGAIKKRIEYAKEKIKDYLDGKIENIEELEIKRFPPRSFDKVGEDIEYNSFSQSLTGGIL